MSREPMQDLYDELLRIEGRLRRLNTTLRQLCRDNEHCRRQVGIKPKQKRRYALRALGE